MLAASRTDGARSSRSTPTTTSCCATSRSASPTGRRRWSECDRFEVEGDVRFGAGVVARGDVKVDGPRTVEDGTVL